MQINSHIGPGFGLGQNKTVKTLGKTNRKLGKILEKLATAQRINRASDDAAGLSISEQLRTQIRGFKTASNNVADAMSALNIADGTATEASSMVQRQRELALQAQNDTLTDDQRQQIDIEYQQLTEEIDRIAQSSEFNTQDVATGEGLASGDAQIQVGPNAGDQ
ncbi:MAG: flagellin, partial [Chitinivibrionales bacterium]|nr:flagellin [Chitinivibrionales bacterium]